MNHSKQLLGYAQIICFLIAVLSCKKEKDDPEVPATPTITTPRFFDDVVFDKYLAYFATNGTLAAPVTEADVAHIADRIDISFTVDPDSGYVAFLDPVTRGSQWPSPFDHYYVPYLNAAIATVLYSTTLTKNDFDAAKTDQSKINEYFTGNYLTIAPHSIYPVGKCLGGYPQQEYAELIKGSVYAFKHVYDGKRGLIWLNSTQATGWPSTVDDTHISLLVEK